MHSDLVDFDFETLHNSLKSLNLKTYIDELSKEREFDVKDDGGNKKQFKVSFEINLDDSALIPSAIEFIIKDTKYKDLLKNIHEIYCATISEDEQTAVKEYLQNTLKKDEIQVVEGETKAV